MRTYRYISLYYFLLVLIQLCSPCCFDSNYCRARCRQSQLRFVLSPLLLHPRLLGTFQSDIPLFTLTWPAKHSPNQGWESTHRLHLYPLGGVFFYYSTIPNGSYTFWLCNIWRNKNNNIIHMRKQLQQLWFYIIDDSLWWLMTLLFLFANRNQYHLLANFTKLYVSI